MMTLKPYLCHSLLSPYGGVCLSGRGTLPEDPLLQPLHAQDQASLLCPAQEMASPESGCGAITTPVSHTVQPLWFEAALPPWPPASIPPP